MPLAPVGGTICALSPARNRRPYCIGSTTKLRIGVMPFCSILPSCELARAAEPLVQLVPDARVGPVLDVLVVIALQIEPRQRQRAHGVERKAAIGVGVDQFVIGRRAFRQDAEPAERIVALEHARCSPSGKLGRQMPWKPSQPAMKSQSISCALPSCVKRIFGRSPVRSCTLTSSTSNSSGPPSAQPLRDQILHHLLLAVDGDALADQLLEIDAVQLAVDADIDAPVQHRLRASCARRRRRRSADRRPNARSGRRGCGFRCKSRLRFSMMIDSMPCKMQQPRQHQARPAPLR